MSICPDCFELVCECSEITRMLSAQEEAKAYAEWIEEPVLVKVRDDAEVASVEALVPGEDPFNGPQQLATFHKLTKTEVPRWVWMAWEAKLEADDELSLELCDD